MSSRLLYDYMVHRLTCNFVFFPSFRIKTDDHTTNETLSKHIEYMADAASRIQPDVKPNVISYSCTSGSIIIGEEKIMAEIKKGEPYAIPMTLVTGVVDALRELQIKKIFV